MTNVDLFGNPVLSFSHRSLPEPLMTYELHGDFIVPASKYCVEVQNTVLWLVVCISCNFHMNIELHYCNLNLKIEITFEDLGFLFSFKR